MFTERGEEERRRAPGSVVSYCQDASSVVTEASQSSAAGREAVSSERSNELLAGDPLDPSDARDVRPEVRPLLLPLPAPLG